jgi:CTP synthase
MTPDMSKWENLVESIETSTDIITIGMVGKYTDLEDAYYSVNE